MMLPLWSGVPLNTMGSSSVRHAGSQSFPMRARRQRGDVDRGSWAADGQGEQQPSTSSRWRAGYSVMPSNRATR